MWVETISGAGCVCSGGVAGGKDGITQFDALDITFTNVGVAYSVKEEKAVLEDVTVRTNRESGFGAYVYSFPTENNGSRLLLMSLI